MNNRKLCLQAALTGLLLACTGCASIFTSGDRNVPITSTPTGATITVYDMEKQVVATSLTPTKIKLKKGAGYFKGAEYRVVLAKSGYQPREFEIKHDINGWYFGNFVIGGLLGFVVVDPLTGAMWSLKPDKIDAELAACPPGTPSTMLEGEKLNIVALDQLSPEQRTHLVLLPTRMPAQAQ